MKKSLVAIFAILLLESCTLFAPRLQFTEGMSESRFRRQNRDAVISSMDNGTRTYRISRGERFYVLATFSGGVLTNIEEREIVPAWMPNQPNQQNQQYQQNQQNEFSRPVKQNPENRENL